MGQCRTQGDQASDRDVAIQEQGKTGGVVGHSVDSTSRSMVSPAAALALAAVSEKAVRLMLNEMSNRGVCHF